MLQLLRFFPRRKSKDQFSHSSVYPEQMSSEPKSICKIRRGWDQTRRSESGDEHSQPEPNTGADGMQIIDERLRSQG